jgi:hypothetical protein
MQLVVVVVVVVAVFVVAETHVVYSWLLFW